MKRRIHRETAFITLFEQSFGYNTLEEVVTQNAEEGEWVLKDYGNELVENYFEYLPEADALIEVKLTGWAMNRIPKVCLILMRIALVEMLFMKTEKVAASVAINEAVELTKKYSAGDDYQFVNGILGSIAREKGIAETPAPEKTTAKKQTKAQEVKVQEAAKREAAKKRLAIAATTENSPVTGEVKQTGIDAGMAENKEQPTKKIAGATFGGGPKRPGNYVKKTGAPSGKPVASFSGSKASAHVLNKNKPVKLNSGDKQKSKFSKFGGKQAKTEAGTEKRSYNNAPQKKAGYTSIKAAVEKNENTQENQKKEGGKPAYNKSEKSGGKN